MLTRDTPSLIEAIRLQKLRAVQYLLDHIHLNPDEDMAVAIEILEDVYVVEEGKESFEQNKNYNPDSSFTLNSEEILNSFCSFIDIWVEHQLSTIIRFCFLSTGGISKEKTTKRIQKLNITLPSEKIIEELSSDDQIKISNVAKVTKSIVFDYYMEKYSTHIDTQKTISILPSISDASWEGFLKQITWVFGHKKVADLDKAISQKIQECKFYSKYENKEQIEIIKASLLELVESKTLNEHKLFRLVQKAEVELRFSNAVYQKKELSQDDVHTLWEQIEKPTDVRNLKDKILAVCPNFDSKEIIRLERKASIAKVDELKLRNSTQYLALKYRVYDFCEEKLSKILKAKTVKVFTEDEINEVIYQINEGCITEFEALRKQYDYGIERNSIILELFIEFLDSCYLSFDK